MVRLKELLEQLQKDPFTDPSDTLKQIDERVRMIVQQYGSHSPAMERFDSQTMLNETLQVEKILDDPDGLPCLVQAVDFVLKNMYQKVKNDIGALFVHNEETGFFNGNVVKFTVSFSLFGSASAMFEKEEAKRKVAETLRAMREKGFVILEKMDGRKRGQPYLLDCDKNRGLLLEYFSQFGVKELRYKNWDDALYEATGTFFLKDYIPDEDPEFKGYEDLFMVKDRSQMTNDQKQEVKKIIKDFISAICSFAIMDDKAMMANLFEGYTYNLESLLACHHTVWEEQDKVCRPSRERSQMAHNKRQNFSRWCFLRVNKPEEIFRRFFKPIEEYAEELGLYVNDVALHEYSVLSFRLSMSPFIHQPSELFDGYDTEERQHFMILSPSKLLEIEQVLQKKFPPIKITQNVEGRFVKGDVRIRSVMAEIRLESNALEVLNG